MQPFNRSSGLVTQEILDLCRTHLPDYPAPRTVFLGGSQVLDGGKHVTKSSDYDVLVFYDSIPQGESLCVQSPNGPRKYDLILRDPQSYAEDIDNGLHRGKGTLLHLTAFGQPLIDRDGNAKNFQAHIASLYERGPYRMHPVTFSDHQQELLQTLDDLSTKTNSDLYDLGLLVLTNRIGKWGLSAMGKWTSSGKVLSRFLLTEAPEFKHKLERAYLSAQETRLPVSLYDIVLNDFPKLYEESRQKMNHTARKFTPLSFAAEPKNLAEATTSVRCNLDALARYKDSRNLIARQAAATWTVYKLDLVGSAVNPDRIGRPSGEYFYAVCRSVTMLSEIAAAQESKTPSQLSTLDRLQSLCARHPEVSKAVNAALNGNPSGLHKIISDEKDLVTEPPLEAFRRPSAPPSFFPTISP